MTSDTELSTNIRLGYPQGHTPRTLRQKRAVRSADPTGRARLSKQDAASPQRIHVYGQSSRVRLRPPDQLFFQRAVRTSVRVARTAVKIVWN